MSTATFEDNTNENVFLEILGRLRAARFVPWHRLLVSRDALRLCGEIVFLKLRSDAALRELRAVGSLCCSGEHLEVALAAAMRVREALLLLSGKELPFVAGLIEKITVDWDDFIDDLTVARDPEFQMNVAELNRVVNAPN